MAGMGKRMRPHTLNVPKPLLKLGDESLVYRIVNELKGSVGKKIDNIHFVIGDFGKEVELNLVKIAENIGAKGHIHYQHEALGTAHAVYCANEGLEGEVIVAFADTLFIGDFNIDNVSDCIIWTMRVKNPEQYGVVLTDNDNTIKKFIEKPKDYISDKAIIGIYYFRNGELLKKDIEKLIENKVLKSGEYQLTDNLLNLLNMGLKIKCQEIKEWLDCGNKDEFLKTCKRFLEVGKIKSENNSKKFSNCLFNGEVYIGNNVELIDSEIGPFVCIGDNCRIIGSRIVNSVIYDNTVINQCEITESMIGNNCKIADIKGVFNLGDYSEYENR